jgi:hypothetical protein
MDAGILKYIIKMKKKLKIYESFLKVNTKYNSKIADFIKKNCPNMLYEIPFLINEKLMFDNSGNTINKQDEIYNSLSLKDLRGSCKFYKDNTCNLCSPKEFIKEKKNLKNLKRKLILENIDQSNKKLLLNNLIKDAGYINHTIDSNENNEFFIKKNIVNLKQRIIFNFFDNFLAEINEINVNKWFLQIAKIYLNKKDFIEDIVKIT